MRSKDMLKEGIREFDDAIVEEWEMVSLELDEVQA